MVKSSNLKRKSHNLNEIKAVLNSMSFNTYPNVMELIRKGVKSTLFDGNKKISELR